MAISIGKLKGMNADLEAKLKAEGLGDSDKLLAATKAPADRKALAKKIGAGEREILELRVWNHRVDHAHVRGLSGAVIQPDEEDLASLLLADLAREQRRAVAAAQ